MTPDLVAWLVSREEIGAQLGEQLFEHEEGKSQESVPNIVDGVFAFSEVCLEDVAQPNLFESRQSEVHA